MYGTRDAAKNWAAEYTKSLLDLGFVQGKASPCNFRHEERELALTVHGDDFTVAGPTDSLLWLKDGMENKYDVKTSILGPEEGMEREIRVLNRTLRWTDGGLQYEADQRHADIIIQQMGMTNARPVTTPMVAEAKDIEEQRKDSKALNAEEATQYRALTARLNYLAQDRPDLQFTAKAVAKYMSEPREHDWLAVKRVARYLVGSPRVTQNFKWQHAPATVVTYTNSDFAGDKTSRRSTSGGAMMLGEHLIKSWSNAQSVVALSSGEAEFYAVLRGAAQTKGLMSMLMDFGLQLDGMIRTDASAALGMAHRQGLGKTRHIEVQYLWTQEEIQRETLAMKQVGTDENMADLLTKSLKPETMLRHMEALGIEVEAGRAATALKIQAVERRDSWARKGREVWQRQHDKPRTSLFTPMKVAGGPRNGGDIGGWRITAGRCTDGKKFVFKDEWKILENPHQLLRKPWTGTTTFVHSCQ